MCIEGRHGKEEIVNNFTGKADVNEEYKEAFRTKSYIETCSRVYGRLDIGISRDEGEPFYFPTSSSLSLSSLLPSSPSIHDIHPSEHLLKPSQELLFATPSSSTKDVHLSKYMLQAHQETLIFKSHRSTHDVPFSECSLELHQETQIFKPSPSSTHEVHHLSEHSLGPYPKTLIPIPSSPSTHDLHHLSEHLLEPYPEILISTSKRSGLHNFLVNYFEASLDACIICMSLLTNVNQEHTNQCSLKNIIKLICLPDISNWTHDQYHLVYINLATFASYGNPFSSMTLEKFHELHDRNITLLHGLTSQCRKIKRRTKLIRCMKRATTCMLMAGCGALAIAFLVQMTHIMVGQVAAPTLILLALVLFKINKMKGKEQRLNTTWLEGLSEQLDIAARGAFILINSFDTMSRLVQRLSDEIEHRKFVAKICVRKRNNEMLTEVVKEFQMHDSCFVEQLEELEKQIHLCILDINRSRRQVAQEMSRC